jgi:hypothetical protein
MRLRIRFRILTPLKLGIKAESNIIREPVLRMRIVLMLIWIWLFSFYTDKSRIQLRILINNAGTEI